MNAMEAALAEVMRMPGPHPTASIPAAGGGGVLPVLPALRELLPRGGLARGSVVAAAGFGLLCLALVAGASADGAWCGIAGIPEAGVLAAAGLGLDAERTLLVPDPGPAWPQVVASLLDGCELVLLRPPARAPAQVRQRLEATLRRGRGVLLVAGDWPGAQLRLRVASQRWTGLGDGHGRLRACCAQVVADGRGEAAMTRTRWLWLPGEDGGIAVADPADLPFDIDEEPPGRTARFLAAQPVSVLADQDLAALLSRLGLGTLGDFAALPVRDVASRFGDAGEGAHRLARGLDSRPLATRPPPADLSVAQEF